jgi:uncharacterized membrane protein YqjE
MEKISETILKFLRLDNFVHHLTGFVEARMELLKAEIREDIAKALSRAMVTVALFFMGFLFLIFFSIGLAHFINRYFSDSFAGYWLVAGIYGAIFLILLLFRKSILSYFEQQFKELTKRKVK